MASRAGSGASPTSSEYYRKQELFWMPGTNGCRIRYPQRISNKETQKGLTAKLPRGAGTSKRSAAVKRDLSGQAMSSKEHAWWAVLIKGKRGNPKRQGKQSGGGNPRVVAIIYCNECAEVLREQVPKRGKAGQSTSECSRELDMRGTEGLASARRLRPHGMPMPYFGWTRLGQGPAGTRENRD